MRSIWAGLISVALGATGAVAQSGVSFEGKTLNTFVTGEAGGGTDAFARLVAQYIPAHLAGSPTIVVRNQGGGDGIPVMNYMVQQAPRDGTTYITASNVQADPLIYRRPQSQFNPAEFPVVGGVGRGGEVLLISKEAEKRLTDKSAAPVVVASLGGVPRSGIQMAAWGAEYLGWNIKWVIGYRGTTDLMLALERGEADMTGTGNINLINKMVESGKFRILVQSGALRDGQLVGRADFGSAPIFARLVDGKIKDKLASQAFEYWSAMAITDKWLGLPPGTPDPIVKTWREAYAKLVAQPDFIEKGKKISDGFDPMTPETVEKLLTTLAALPKEATEYMSVMLKKQGLDVK